MTFRAAGLARASVLALAVQGRWVMPPGGKRLQKFSSPLPGRSALTFLVHYS